MRARPRWRCAARSPPRPSRAPPPTTRRSRVVRRAGRARFSPRRSPSPATRRAAAALWREPASAGGVLCRRRAPPGVATARQTSGQGTVLQQSQRHRRRLSRWSPSSTRPAVAIIKHANPCGVAVAARSAPRPGTARSPAIRSAPLAASSRSTAPLDAADRRGDRQALRRGGDRARDRARRAAPILARKNALRVLVDRRPARPAPRRA